MPIELEHLTKKYGDVTAVDDLTLTFEDQSLNVLIGPSGCGKTTTLEMLNRLRTITSGDIKYDGVSIHDIDPIQLRRGIGYVIQEIGLFPHMTIYENIAVVPRLVGWRESRIRDRVTELLELVNLDPNFDVRYPAELSGGQRQRVGVARGLAADPKILLMDEPFGAIDPINREILQDSFLEIQREIQKTIVFVTHDIREAVKLGDKIALLDNGKLVQFDTTTQLLTNPANEFVEDMLGSDRALKGLELMRVEDHADTSYFSINPDNVTSAAEARTRLENENRGSVFLVDDDRRLQGYVTLEDLVQGRKGDDLTSYAKTAHTVQPVSTLMEAISKMVTAGITRAPVVDQKNRMIGVVRFRDLFDRLEGLAAEKDEE